MKRKRRGGIGESREIQALHQHKIQNATNVLEEQTRMPREGSLVLGSSDCAWVVQGTAYQHHLLQSSSQC